MTPNRMQDNRKGTECRLKVVAIPLCEGVIDQPLQMVSDRVHCTSRVMTKNLFMRDLSDHVTALGMDQSQNEGLAVWHYTRPSSEDI